MKNTLAMDVNTLIDPLIEAWIYAYLAPQNCLRGTSFSHLQKPDQNLEIQTRTLVSRVKTPPRHDAI
jgi:hypothetical protein